MEWSFSRYPAVTLFKNANASTMMGFEQATLPVTEAIGGCSSLPPNRF